MAFGHRNHPAWKVPQEGDCTRGPLGHWAAGILSTIKSRHEPQHFLDFAGAAEALIRAAAFVDSYHRYIGQPSERESGGAEGQISEIDRK